MAISIKKAAAGFKRFGQQYPKAVVAAMRAGLLLSMRATLREYILSQAGPPVRRRLTHRSGALGRTVKIIEPRLRSGAFEGGLQAGSSSVPYARIHELGGITRPHLIRPRRRKYLSWIDRRSGKRVFRKSVMHPGSRMPKRPYLAPGLRAGWPQTQKQIAVALELAAAKALR